MTAWATIADVCLFRRIPLAIDSFTLSLTPSGSGTHDQAPCVFAHEKLRLNRELRLAESAECELEVVIAYVVARSITG